MTVVSMEVKLKTSSILLQDYFKTIFRLIQFNQLDSNKAELVLFHYYSGRMAGWVDQDGNKATQPQLN